MIDSNITQVYCTSPDEQTLLEDLQTKDLAEEDENGDLQPIVNLTVWNPRNGTTTDEDGNEVYTYANTVMATIGWTEHWEEVADTGSLISELRQGGPFPGGTEVEVNLNSLSFHSTEPRITTYGAPNENTA